MLDQALKVGAELGCTPQGRVRLGGSRLQLVSLAAHLERLLGLEVDATAARRHAGRLRLDFPAPWRIEDFDFDAQPGVDRKLVEDLATLRFIHEASNVLLVGPVPTPATGDSTERCKAVNVVTIQTTRPARQGYDIINLDGGLQAWARGGLPLATADGGQGRVILMFFHQFHPKRWATLPAAATAPRWRRASSPAWAATS